MYSNLEQTQCQSSKKAINFCKSCINPFGKLKEQQEPEHHFKLVLDQTITVELPLDLIGVIGSFTSTFASIQEAQYVFSRIALLFSEVVRCQELKIPIEKTYAYEFDVILRFLNGVNNASSIDKFINSAK